MYIYIYSYITYFAFPNQGLPVKRNSRGQDRQTANLSPAGETAATYSAYIKDLDQLLLDASCTLLTSLLSLSVFFIHVILMIVHFQTQLIAAPRVVSKLSGKACCASFSWSKCASGLYCIQCIQCIQSFWFEFCSWFCHTDIRSKSVGTCQDMLGLAMGWFPQHFALNCWSAVGKLPSFPRHSPRYFVVACCAISFVGDLLAAVECQWWTQSCELKAEICSCSKLSNFQETLVQ